MQKDEAILSDGYESLLKQSKVKVRNKDHHYHIVTSFLLEEIQKW